MEMEMGINFRKEKRSSLLGKRYRDQVDDKDDDRKVESEDMEIHNFQTETMDFSLGKPYDDENFDENLVYHRLAVPEKQRRGKITTEVFRVIINMEKGREGCLSGKIYFSNVSENIYIYKHGGVAGQYIKAIKEGCDLLTTVSGRNHVIQSYDDVYVFVDLLLSSSEDQHLISCDIPQDKVILDMDHPFMAYLNGKGTFEDSTDIIVDFFSIEPYDMENDDTDDEIEDVVEDKFVRITNCKGCFGKNGKFKENKFRGLVYNPSEEIFDKPSSYTVLGKDNKCSVTILYALFREAIQAVVEVVWLKDEELESGVYGLIAAKNDMIKDNAYEIILFLKENLSRSVPVVSGQPIQLSRSVVAVPINSNLLVRAHLRTKDKDFPSAKLLFPAQQSGVSELSIKDTMQVKVTWQHFW